MSDQAFGQTQAFGNLFPHTNAVLSALSLHAQSISSQCSPTEIATRLACAQVLLQMQPEMDEIVARQLQQLLLKNSLSRWKAELRTSPTASLSSNKESAPSSGVLAMAQCKLSVKKRSNLNRPARVLLINWLRDHARNPYPTEAEKIDLATSADVSKEQITNFFINARGRTMWRDIAEKQGLSVARDAETNKWYAE